MQDVGQSYRLSMAALVNDQRTFEQRSTHNHVTPCCQCRATGTVNGPAGR